VKKKSTFILLLCALLFSSSTFSLPLLNSLTSATPLPTIYLDFDGENVNSSWNGGVPFTAAPSGMTDAQITEAFNRVAEDYRPFEINITTDLAKFLAAPFDKRIRLIVTPTSAWYPGVGGITYIGSFGWGDDTPGFVFTDKLPIGGPVSAKLVGECCSHEGGHALFLGHQSKYDVNCVLTEQYNSGIGAGETSWAPIMGSGYTRNMSCWNNGATPTNCTNTQDNLSIITSYNGFTYRVDDYTESLDASAASINLTSINKSGIITTTTDKDAFRMVSATNTSLHLDIKPFSVGPNNDGADLDVKVLLYNSASQLIRTYDPISTMNVTIDTNLNAGTYYIVVDGTGNTNVGDYGSLGSYTITGFTTPLPIKDVALTGINTNGKHQLKWNIVADEKIQNIAVQSSTDGISFKTLTNADGQATNFTYAPFEKTDLYYRLKVTSVINQNVFSNTILLKGTGKTAELFTVSTLVRSTISINAADNYQYALTDINGRMIAKGNGQKGIEAINIDNQPSGMYILQLINNNIKQTERIIKQ
jgi:hypothetical protein